ncbi:MAG: class I SAM-dependent methyltransferase [Gemmatimonadetes bacterium]|nr:class I SAM-dependent methyltransferase [Gemmatimonadota bacterium]
MTAKTYDRAYFDRWYRDPKARVATRAAVERKVALVLGVAEALLQRPVRSVLDVGCGEATWRAPLRARRRGLSYTGVDSSAYVVARFGRTRGIRAGTFATLADVALAGPFDVIVCCDVLQYVPPRDLGRGLRAIAALLGGVTYLEAYTTADAIEGDRRAWHDRSPSVYRAAFRRAGLTSVGMHCYVGDALRPMTAALERGAP